MVGANSRQLKTFHVKGPLRDDDGSRKLNVMLPPSP